MAPVYLYIRQPLEQTMQLFLGMEQQPGMSEKGERTFIMYTNNEDVYKNVVVSNVECLYTK